MQNRSLPQPADHTTSSEAHPTRRQFLRQTVRGTSVVVVIQHLAPWLGDPQALGQSIATENLLGKQVSMTPTGLKSPKTPWIDENGKVKYRFDGLAKILGTKIYGRDFRAKDLTGWPQLEGFAHVVRGKICDQAFKGLDTVRLKDKIGCDKVVTSADLAAWSLKAPAPYWVPTPFVALGSRPLYFGQPLGILFFPDRTAYRRAKPLLLDLGAFVQYESAAAGVTAPRPPFGTSKFVSYLGNTGGSPDDADLFAGKIQQELKAQATNQGTTPPWRIFQAAFETQSVDPVFMEPECGLGWYDTKTQCLSLTYGTQSPQDDLDAILSFLGSEQAPKISKVSLNVCLPGGGFGGRDSSEFPLLLALAALLKPDTTQRIIYSRFDQFQAGLKRHATQCHLTIAVNTKSPKKAIFEVLHSKMNLDGGGQNNYSFAVQNVGARNMPGAYDFQRSIVESEAFASQNVPAGSMRGFGSSQGHFALECLVDEIAIDLKLDPVQVRLQNLMPDHKQMHTGVLPAHDIPSRRVLEKLQDCPLWKFREKDQKQRSTPEKLYGVGMALAVKSYGKNPGDTCLASVSIDPDGGLSLGTHSVDMGNGTATTLPLVLFDILGRAASRLLMGSTEHFSPLDLAGPKAKDQEDQDKLAHNPRWVPSRSMSTAASAGAYQMRHPVVEAGKILFERGIWPAACALWGIDHQDLQNLASKASWKKGLLTYKSHRPLAWTELVDTIYKTDGLSGVMVHSFYRGTWAEASFALGGRVASEGGQSPATSMIHAPIDALAVKHGAKPYGAVDRHHVTFPPYKNLMKGANRYTPYGLVVAVEVNRAPGPNQGQVKVVAAEGFLECGTVIQQDIVTGQMEGAFAMGIGQTLLEDFSDPSGGPGQGAWNLHRYQVPLSRHCALQHTTFTILPATPTEAPKGMAEVVFNAVPPAIANAIAHGTGARFRRLPITAEDIKKRLV